MKSETNAQPIRSHNKLRSRLMRVFSALFVFCVLTMSFFLFSLVRMITLNNLSRTVFEETRQVNLLSFMFKRYELGMKQYAISSSYLAKEELSSLGKRIDETIVSLQAHLPPEDQQTLAQLADHNARLNDLSTQVLAAVDAEDAKDPQEQDWDSVQALDESAGQVMIQMYGALDEISSRGATRLQSIKDEAWLMSTLSFLGRILAVLLFLVLALIAAVTIYQQISLPAGHLARAVQDLNEGKPRFSGIDQMLTRDDEIGELAREFVRMELAIHQRKGQLSQEIEEVRAKIKEHKKDS